MKCVQTSISNLSSTTAFGKFWQQSINNVTFDVSQIEHKILETVGNLKLFNKMSMIPYCEIK